MVDSLTKTIDHEIEKTAINVSLQAWFVINMVVTNSYFACSKFFTLGANRLTKLNYQSCREFMIFCKYYY